MPYHTTSASFLQSLQYHQKRKKKGKIPLFPVFFPFFCKQSPGCSSLFSAFGLCCALFGLIIILKLLICSIQCLLADVRKVFAPCTGCLLESFLHGSLHLLHLSTSSPARALAKSIISLMSALLRNSHLRRYPSAPVPLLLHQP